MRLLAGSQRLIEETLRARGPFPCNRIDAVEGGFHVETGGVGHEHGAELLARIEPHHAVETTAAAFLEQVSGPAARAHVPPEGHRNRSSRGSLWLDEERAGPIAEQTRMRSKLVPQERAEACGRADEAAKRGSIQIVIANAQPWTLVVADQGAIDEPGLDQIEQGISPGSPPHAWRDRGRVGELVRADAERTEDVIGDVRGERLSARLLHDAAEQPVSDVLVLEPGARRESEPPVPPKHARQLGALVEGLVCARGVHPTKRNRIRSARRVRKQLPDGELAAVRLRADVTRHRIVEPDAVRFDELQNRRGRDGLAHRIRHHRDAGTHRALARDVGDAGNRSNSVDDALTTTY